MSLVGLWVLPVELGLEFSPNVLKNGVDKVPFVDVLEVWSSQIFL